MPRLIQHIKNVASMWFYNVVCGAFLGIYVAFSNKIEWLSLILQGLYFTNITVTS